MQSMNRRQLLGAGAALAFAAGLRAEKPETAEPFAISLAEWSLHRALRSQAGDRLDNLDFPRVAREDYGIAAVEYVNQFWKDKATDHGYLVELRKRCEDHGVESVLIMCDGEGMLGDPDPGRRAQSIESHHRWVDAARFLGCHAIRVNAQSSGGFEEQMALVADGLARLAAYGAEQGIRVIVENHGGLSANGAWLAGVMRKVGSPWCGTLPDFGGFAADYDRYQGVDELMPFARGVSAKSQDFDAAGNETHTDYFRMIKIVLDAGYHGHVGIEYEGNSLSEPEGIRATKRLLERVSERAEAGQL